MTDRPALDTPPEQPRDDGPKLRQCLRCEDEFESEWSGERICRRCKTSATWRGGLPHVFRTRG